MMLDGQPKALDYTRLFRSATLFQKIELPGVSNLNNSEGRIL
jgi:hypothetical protein